MPDHIFNFEQKFFGKKLKNRKKIETIIFILQIQETKNIHSYL